MHKLQTNTPLFIFAVGATLFLIAPLQLIPAFTSEQTAMAGLVIESLGITAGFVSYFKDKAINPNIKET